MVDIPLDTYEITITAVDTRKNEEIISANFVAWAAGGQGPATGSLPMYDPAKPHKPIKYALSCDPKVLTSTIWKLQAENRDPSNGPLFYAEHMLDITAEPNVRFLITPKQARG